MKHCVRERTRANDRVLIVMVKRLIRVDWFRIVTDFGQNDIDRMKLNKHHVHAYYLAR